MKKRWMLAVASAVVLVLAGTVTVAGGATAATLSRAPYVTDLTTTSAYVNWAIEGQQTAGSVMVQPAVGGVCPASIKWTSAAITTPTKNPLVSGSSATTSWKITVGTTTEYQAETPVTGLKASTQYCYAVYSTHSSSAQELWPVQTFTTLGSSNLTFDVLGDTGDTSLGPNAGEQAIYQEIGASNAQFLLMAGDVSYNGGTETSYGDLNQTGADVSDIFGPSYFPHAKGIPTFVADGNHGQTNDDLRIWPEPSTVAASNGVYSYGAPPAQVDGITNQSPSDWYAIQTGDVRIYVLDAAWADGSASTTGTATGAACGAEASHCTGYQADADEHWQLASSEYQWLAKDLAAHPGGVKMAVWHYPLASDNQTEVTDPYLGNLDSLLSANGVQVAFNGHAHTYQRIQPTNGLTNFVTGGGGGSLQTVATKGSAECQAFLASGSIYALGWDPGLSTGKPVGSECSTGNIAPTPTSPMQVYNYLQVTVSGTQVTVNAVNALGQTFDTASFSYGAQQDTQPPSVPTGLATTSVTSTSVGLTWNPSTDNVGVTGYDVLRNGVQIGTTPSPSFTDSTVAAGTTYQYTVEAFDAAGNNSGPGTALPVTTPSGSPPPGVSFVQHASATAKTVSLTSTAGDLLTLSASLYTGATNHITAISDSAGDAWKQDADANSAGHNSDGELWYAVAKGGPTAITVATNASNVALDVQEFSGLGATPTVTAASASSTGTAASSGTASGTGLVVGFVAGHANAEHMTPPGAFVNEPQVQTASPVASLVDGYELSVTGGTTYGASLGAAMYWSAGVAVFTP